MIAMENTNNRGKLLVAIFAMLVVFAGATIVLSDSIQAAPDANDVASIGDVGYDTLDEAVQAANSQDGIQTITLLKDATLNEFLTDVTITSNGDVTLTLQRAIQMEGTVTVSNVEIAATTGMTMLFYVGYTGNVSASFDNVTFDESTVRDNGKNMTIYTDSDANISVSNSDLQNCSIVYAESAGTIPTLNLSNNTNVDLSISYNDEVTLGTSNSNINVTNTTFGTIALAVSPTLIIAQGTTITADEIINYDASANGTVVNNGTLAAAVEDGILSEESTGTSEIVISDVTTLNSYLDQEGELTIYITSGEDGYFDLSADVDIKAGKTVIFNNVTVRASSDENIITVSAGEMVTNNAYIYAGVDVQENGEYTSSNTHNESSSGTITGSREVGFGDTFTYSGTINQGATLKVYGTLIANDITVNGTVESYIGSDVTINGTATIAGTFTLQDKAQLVLNGTINVRNDTDGNAKLELQGASEMTVAADGVLNVYRPTANTAIQAGYTNSLIIGAQAKFMLEGNMTITGTLSGVVHDKGTLNFNGTVAQGTTASIVPYDGVTVSIQSVTGTISISDAGQYGEDIVLDMLGRETLGNTREVSCGNTITLTNVMGVTVSMDVNDSMNKANTYRIYTCNMTVTGTVAMVANTTDLAHTVVINGNAQKTSNGGTTQVGTMTVGDMTVGAGVAVTFQNIVEVTGSVTAVFGTAVDNPGSITNSGELTVSGTITLSSNSINGTNVNAAYYYTVGSDGVQTYYYTNFDNALAEVDNSYDDTIQIYGDVDADTTADIPAGMTVQVNAGAVLTIGEDCTITVVDGAYMYVTGTVDVEGTLVITNTDTGLSYGTLKYDVYRVNGKTATYTNLANALATANPGDVITLNQPVTISGNVTIPEQVTVQTGRNTVTFADGATLTVDGTFYVNGGTLALATTPSGLTWDDVSIVANGVVSMDDSSDSDSLAAYGIDGAHFTLRNVDYVTNVAYAAENVSEGDISIQGDVTTSDVTFTSDSDEGLTVTVEYGSVFSFGTITLDGSSLVIEGTATGSVSADAAGATATIDLNRVAGFQTFDEDDIVDGEFKVTIASVSRDGASGATDYMFVSGDLNRGTLTVSEGTVTVLEGTSRINSTDGTMQGSVVVSNGATLVVPESANLYIRSDVDTSRVALSVEGTMNIETGVVYNYGVVEVSGTLNITDSGRLDVTYSDYSADHYGSLSVTGTVNVASEEGETNVLNVTTVISVGGKPTTLGTANGSGIINGKVEVSDNGYIKAYPGSDLTGADINEISSGESQAVSTVFHINNTVYMTVYADDANNMAIEDVVYAESFELLGLQNGLFYDVPTSDEDNRNTGLYDITDWSYQSDLAQNARLGINASTQVIGFYDDVYAHADAAMIPGTISEGTGLSLYIDNIRYNSVNFPNGLQVGTHTVSFEVQAQYDGSNAVITFNGQTVQNGGTITITADMTSFTLVANGAVPASSGGQDITVNVPSQDDGMSLTDILLIVLVVLILVMAIIVALRLMRS